MGVFFSSSSISFLRKIVVHFSSCFYVFFFCSPIPLVGGWSFVHFSGFCLYVFVRCWCSFLIYIFFFLSLIDLFVIVVDIIYYFIYGWGARCSSVVRAFAHDVMGRWIDPS